MNNHEEHIQRLRKYVQQIAPSSELEAFEAEALESLGDPSPAEEPEFESFRQGMRKLVRNETLDPSETEGLEAIIHRRHRPAIDVVEDTYHTPPHPWTHLGEAGPRGYIEQAIPSIARVEVPNHPSIPYGGTAFVVGENLIMTNRHVAEVFSSGLGRRGLFFQPGQVAGLDFRREIIPSPPIYVEVREVVMVHPYWDMALLRVAELPAPQRPLRLSIAHPDDLAGHDVVIVGYPAQDWRNDLALQNRIFRGVFNVKRMQPGKIVGRGETRSYGKDVMAVTHDSSTLGGNSGSAVLDVTTGEVIGLHFAGRYLEANYAVPTWELARDPRVVDAGLQFAGNANSTAEWDSFWRDADPPVEAQPSPPVSVSVPAPPTQTPVTASVAAPAGETAIWTLPLQISIRLGTPTRGAGAPLPATGALDAAAIEAPGMSIKPEPDYENRPGYDPAFLGDDHIIRIPWLTNEQYNDVAFNQLASRQRHVLPYHHFSLVMSKTRRLPYFTVSNIDGKRERNISRDDFSDKWFLDPRIPARYQLQNDLYIRNPLDRGHLVRRLDPTWGRTFKEAKKAHDDTFHWTNCSPQHERFNRNKSTWGGIENYILYNANAKDLRVTVFTGPVFRDNDPIFTTESGDQVPIPTDFWKIVVMVKHDDSLSATAYLLSQEALVDQLVETTFTFGTYKTFQKPVATIEELTHLSFHNLRNFDPLANDAQEGIAEIRDIELHTLEDLVL